MVTRTRLIVTFVCGHYNARLVLRCVLVCGVEGFPSVSLFTRFVGTFSTPLASPGTKVRGSVRVSSSRVTRYRIYVNEIEN